MQRYVTTLLFSLSLLFSVGTAPALGQTNTSVEWDSSRTTNGETPSYMSDGMYTRSFGAGMIKDGSGGMNGRVLVPISQQSAGLEVSVVDETGTDTGNDLNLDLGNTIPDRNWAIRDVDVTADGNVIACKLTTNDEGEEDAAGGLYRCYRWQDETASPTELQFDGSAGYSDGDGNEDRLGVFTATGSFSDDNLTLWAAEDGGTQVHRFEWVGSQFTSTAINLTDENGDPVTLGAYAKVAPKGTGATSFYLNSVGTPAWEFNVTGVEQQDLSAFGLHENTEAITRFTAGGDEFIFTHNHNGGSSPDGLLVNLTQGQVVATTTDLSAGASSADEADVVVREQGNGDYVLYTMANETGLGAYSTDLQNPLATEWNNSETTDGQLPSFISSGTFTRGFAAGTVNDGQGGTKRRVLVPISKQSAGLEISIVDDTGMDTDEDLNLDLDNTIPDRDWAVRDVDVTADGNVIACKLTTNDEGSEGAASGLYRCYRWQDETASPTELQFDGSAGYSDGDGTADRLGVFTATGSFSDNSLTLWAAEDGGTQVHRFEWDGSQFTSTVTNLTDGSGNSVALGGFPKVAPEGTGATAFYLNSDGTPAWKFNASGEAQQNLSSMGLGEDTEAITWFTAASGSEYLLAHSHATGGASDAKLVNVTQGTVFGESIDLGGSNRAENDVAVMDNGDNTYTAFVYSNLDGVGSYTTVAAPLPVEMASFGVESSGSHALLTWQTASETNNAGFEVQHQAPTKSGWTSLGFVESKATGGTATQAQSYRFATEALRGGTHTFRLKQVDTDGSATLTETRTVTIRGEAGLRIGGANPIVRGGSVPVTVQVNAGQAVEVALYDVLGRRVRTVLDEEVRSGQPVQKQLSTGNLSSGVYFLRASGESLEETHRVTVVR